MRSLRRQLIRLLDQARIEQHAERVPPRIAAALVHDFMTLLPLGEHSEAVALRVRSISHRDIHRHIVTIRCPDQAFFLDAIKGYLLKKGITPLMQQTMVAMIECDERQCVLELKPPGEQAEANFMFIALHISATLVKDIRPCARDIHAILRAVHLSVRDFAPMRRHVADCATRLLGTQPDAGALLEWLNDNRYLYFGLRHRRMRLGLFRDARTMRHVAPGLAEAIATLPPPERCGVEWFPLPALHHYLYSAATVELARISWRADDGALAWTLVLGHFSRSARHTNASHTPVLAARWRRLAQSRLLRHSAFYQREIRTIYDRLPKPALLCTQPEDWLKPMRNTVDMANATDATCALLPPRTPGTPILYIAISALRYGPNTRQALFDRLRDEAGIVVHGHESIGIGPHRVILAYCDANLRHGAPISGIDITHVQHLISDAVTFWKDRAKAAILAHSEHFSVPAALAEVLRVPPLYEHLFPPEQLWRDIAMRQRIHQDGRIHIRLRRMDPTHLDIHVLSARPLLLGRMVNQIQAFGLLAEQESMVPLGNAGLTLHINRIVARANDPLDEPTLNRLHVGLERVFNKMADHDPLNELILTTGLSINEVAILITLRNYLIQLLPDAARPPLIDMLLKHAECSRRLIDYFIQLHHPHIERRNAAAARQAFLDALERVTTLTEDRWFRALEALVTASLRTNAFTRAPDAPIALKIDPRQLDFIPEPKPWRETFVHGVELEGIHLR
ncbi:MAG: NAD-glutamate dehydrogenase, partial [Zetaproteobacteria bacterium]